MKNGFKAFLKRSPKESDLVWVSLSIGAGYFDGPDGIPNLVRNLIATDLEVSFLFDFLSR
jgi:hypothetical protein